MATPPSEQQPNFPPKSSNKRFYRTRWFIAGISLLIVAAGACIWIFTNLSIFTTILPILIFTVLSVLIALFQWLFPLTSTSPEQTPAHLHTSQVPQNAPVVQQIQPIIVQVPSSQPLPKPDFLSSEAPYRRIIGFPPPIDQRTIQQREEVVKEVYERLTQTNITAIVLTGIGGAGKSTLAALTYRYAEEQRTVYIGPFLAETLWLTIDPTVTFADLIGNLFEALSKPMPDLSNLASQNQAVTLFNALNTTEKPYLIILDQFENLLDWDTGHALVDRPGIGEWLDIINSQQCRCRILLTSRPRPIGTREYPPTYLHEYAVKGLEIIEGVELLRKRGVVGTEEELQMAVMLCEGHAFSLTLLASLIQDHTLNLTQLLKDSALWIGNIAQNLLDYMYSRQLNQIQRELLLAFSVYREPVLLEAAEAILTSSNKSQVLDALKALRTECLIEPTGEGHYQLHAIITAYAHEHFDESSEQNNKDALSVAHRKAADYYHQRVIKTCPPLEKRRNVNDIRDLIETIWQYCQAEQWQEAYNLIEQEEVFPSLKKWGSNALLLELCLLLQPQGNWSLQSSQLANIHFYVAWVYNALGKWQWARDNYEQALQLYTESGHLEGKANVLDSLGWSYYVLGQMRKAKDYYEQSLTICKEIGKRQGVGHALNGLGRVSIIEGQKKQALEYFEEALDISKEVEDLRLEGRTLSNLGLVYTDFEDYVKALGYLEQSLTIRKQVGDRRGESVTLNNLGRVYKERGENARAMKCFEEALGICQEIGDRGTEGWTLNNLGWVYNAIEQYEQAKTILEQALHIRQEVGDRRGECRTARNLGLSLSMLGQKEQALEYYKLALIISHEIQDRYSEGTVLQNVAMVYRDTAQYDIALSCFLIAKNIFDEIHSPQSNNVQKEIDALHRKIGAEQFEALLTKIEPQAQHVVSQVLLGEL